MSEYAYQAFVNVPIEIVQKIGNDLEDKLGTQLVLNCDFLTASELEEIKYRFRVALRELVADSAKSVEGYTLTSGCIMAIARYLKNHKKIDAIKEFRSATGAALRDAKDFIDRFGMGHDGASQFLKLFQ